MKDNPHGYELPEIVNPDTISFCIEVPDEPFHLRAFWGAMLSLTHAYNWGNDDAHTAIDVAEVWRNLWIKNHRGWRERGCETAVNCNSFSPASPHLTWFPENPYNPEPEPPDGYEFHPWTVVNNGIIDSIISVFGLGYKVGDVFTDITKFPLFAGWDDILTDYAGLPYIKLEGFSGKGTVKLELLNIYQGGRILLFKDGYVSLNPLEWQSVEMNRDEISFPPETEVEIIIEVEFDTAGEHFLDIVFAPVVDDALIPLFFGAGIRGFELCGFGREGCNCMSEECCDDLISGQNKTNLLLDKLVSLFEDGFKIVPIGGKSTPPDSGAGSCAPDYFDHDTDESGDDLIQRSKALCITAERYVKQILLMAVVEMLAPAFLVDWINGSISQSVPLPLQKIEVVYASAFAGIAALVSAASGSADLKIIACRMVARLTGDKNNTFANFRDSIVLADFDDLAILQPIAGLVQATNGLKSNYLLFNEALEQAFDEDLDAYECPCDEAPPVDDCGLSLEDFLGTGCTITPMGDCIYRFTFAESPDGGVHWLASFRDSMLRCLKVEFADGYPTPSVSDTNMHGCCASVDYEGVGGFAPASLVDVGFRTGTDVPQYYKITLQDMGECP